MRTSPHVNEETVALQPLGVERHAKPIVSNDLDQLAALAVENDEISTMRVATEGFLHQHGQRVHSAANIDVASRNPSPYAGRNGDPHPSRGRKFDLDCPAAGRTNWTKSRHRFRTIIIFAMPSCSVASLDSGRNDHRPASGIYSDNAID